MKEAYFLQLHIVDFLQLHPLQCFIFGDKISLNFSSIASSSKGFCFGDKISLFSYIHFKRFYFGNKISLNQIILSKRFYFTRSLSIMWWIFLNYILSIMWRIFFSCILFKRFCFGDKISLNQF